MLKYQKSEKFIKFTLNVEVDFFISKILLQLVKLTSLNPPLVSSKQDELQCFHINYFKISKVQEIY